MRKVIFSIANSPDNYIARKDGAVDWLLLNEEATSELTEFWNTIDAVVIGRKTYEPVLKTGTDFPAFPGVKNYVLSRMLKENPDKSVEIIREDAVEFVRRLKTEEGKDIFVMGGSLMAKQLLCYRLTNARLRDTLKSSHKEPFLRQIQRVFYFMKTRLLYFDIRGNSCL